MPRLSVILPAYNAGDFLRRSAGSVLANTYRDLELIIVDDGSSDSTGDICAALARGDGRVRIIRQENAGVSCARNRGVDEASGELIALVDADDFVEPDAYETMISLMDGSGAGCAACSYYDEFPGGSRADRSPPMPEGVYGPEDVRRGIVLPLLCDRLSTSLLLGTVWRYVFSARVIKEGGIRFSGAYLEDEMFLIEYFSHPCTLAVSGAALYGYMQNPASVTKRYLRGFAGTFMRSMEIKAELVERFDIPAPPEWRLNSAWAGLLIAASNEFAPGAPAGGAGRLRTIAAMPLFAEAVRDYVPRGMSRNKTLAAFCLRHRLYGLLAALYAVKNRGR